MLAGTEPTTSRQEHPLIFFPAPPSLSSQQPRLRQGPLQVRLQAEEPVLLRDQRPRPPGPSGPRTQGGEHVTGERLGLLLGRPTVVVDDKKCEKLSNR